jgi:N-acyl-D-amino-acid deacylase
MRFRLIILTFAAVALLSSAIARADEAPPLHGSGASADQAKSPSLDGLDTFIERTMAEWKMPGLAIAVVNGSELMHNRGYGHRDQEKSLPVTSRTLFAIGSISKSFTVTGLGMLVDEGKADWDRPVRDVLPEFRLMDHVASESASLRDLVSHRTGLPRHDRVWYRSGLSRPQLVDSLRHLELNRELRSVWQYNNLMYATAGYAQERISGKTWEDITKDRIFKPLVMESSNFSVETLRKSDDFASPYAKIGQTIQRVPFCNLDALGPAGSINSSVDEMIRYVRLHLDSGKYGDAQLLSKVGAGRMQTPQMVLPENEAGPLHASTYSELGHTSYGLGFFITTYRGHKLVWHSGSIDGYSAMMAMLPQEKIGLIILTNLSGNRPVPVCVTRYVFDRLLGLEPIDWVARAKELDSKAEKAGEEARKREDGERKSSTSPSHETPAYAGTFEHPAYGKVAIALSDKRLTFSWRGVTVPLNHRQYDIFETAVDEDSADDSTIPKIRVTFSYDARGDINRLSMPLEPRVKEIAFTRSSSSSERSLGDTVAAKVASESPYDLLLLGGRVVDGSGNAWFLGDIGVRAGRITRVAPAGFLKEESANLKIDAKGMVVAPGFIDIQGHSRDELLTGDGRVIGKVTQGVTTEILGEGTTNAPSKEVKEFDGRHGFDAWLKAMERHGASINFGSFLGSGTVRSYAKGMAQGAPTSAELETMKELVQNAMNDGAFGLASALIYPPDNYVSTEDLIALSREMAPKGGVYITHMRSEGDQLLEAIDEAIRIGRDGGVPVEIYHLKAAGKRNWGKAAKAIDAIAAARARGQDVGADMYPYTAGGTGLTACLPPWSAADGKLFKNLADADVRAKIRAEILHPTSDWENLGELAGPENVLVLGLEKVENRKHAGRRLSEIAADLGKDWIDTAMDLILSEHHRIDTIYFMMSEDNVKLQLRQPWIKIGTDASGHDPDQTQGLVHPRSYGTYPRIFAKYVRDEGVISLEEAVRKTTSAVASRLSIRDRGLLREGHFADVVVFDLSTIADRATYEKPHQVSAGVRDVFVNGVAVVRDGKHTGAKPGQIVRGPGYATSSGK